MQTTLRLDLDEKWDNSQLEDLEKRVAFVSDIVGIPIDLVMVWPSHNGGAHVILTAYREDQHLHPIEVVALQCLLGSDLNREAFNLQRARVLDSAPTFWHSRWNVQYSEKLEGKHHG